MKKAFTDIIKGLFPEVCEACEENLSNDNLLCVLCMYELPITDQFFFADNRFTKHFIGRVNIVHGAAYLDFYKEGIAQVLMHKLKYKGKYYIGEFLGRMAGKKLIESPLFSQIDAIIPVPLHSKKKSRRGYNQCEAFASGISEVTKIPQINNALLKMKNTPSQTAKSRTERIANVENSYSIDISLNLDHKHILLVDDVITTGATLEACAITLAKHYQNIRISMLTIAIANS